MTTLSFYARGDGSSANNAALNVENQSQQPTVQLTFDSGPTGDIVLEHNGGAEDPDTTVIINGISYNFRVELTGDLPLGSPKVPDPLEGKTITVISVVIGGNTERFFFVNDGSGTPALMDQFRNGAIALDNTDFAPPPVLICFCGGTEISTPAGYRKVETLQIGDLVLTDQADAKPIAWIGRTEVSPAQMLAEPERRPIRIAANALAPGVPFSDLYVSAQHGVVLKGPETELLFGERSVLVGAKHLVGSAVDRVIPTAAVTYYHLFLEDHDMVISNGLVSESLQLSQRAFAGMSHDAQRSLSDALPEGALQACFQRPASLRSLKSHEAGVLVQKMFGKQSNPPALKPDLLPFGAASAASR